MSLVFKLIGRKCLLSIPNTNNKFNNTLKNLIRYSSGKTFNIKKNEYNVSASFGEQLIEFNLDVNNTKIGKKIFPYIWLRDNCKCSKCFNYTTYEVDLDLAELSIDSKPIQITEKDEKVEIKWDDGHISEYNVFDLTKYALNNELNSYRKLSKSRVYWNTDILTKNNTTKGFDQVNYKDYVHDKKVLEKAMLSIYKYGAVIVNGVAKDPKEMVNLCKPIGAIQPTVFGDNYCVVTNKSEQFSDRAYTNLSLRAHTDNVYLKNNSGLECFHIISKPKYGGDSLFVDGFYCAQILKKLYKEDYDFLSKTHVEFEFSKEGEFSHKIFDKHITENPINNELYQIRINSYHKTNLCHLNKDQLQHYYKAIKNFIKIIRDSNNEFWISLREDQVIIFDNFRLLHGRSQIDGLRTLVTAYLSRDDYLSKLTVTNNINDF